MNTKFFTGEGDQGQSKIGKSHYLKSNFLFAVLGGFDELNSWLGFCRAEAEKIKIAEPVNIAVTLKNIQEILFIVQAEVAALGFNFDKNTKKITVEKIEFLEDVIKKIDEVVPPITKFIIPGASELSARLDVGRALSRKVEKMSVGLSRRKELSPELLKFLNRLSSVLFALARYANYKLGVKEDNPTYQ